MSEPAQTDVPYEPTPRENLVFIALAVGSAVIWTSLYNRVAGLGLCDEPGHWGIIEHFRDGRPGWPDSLPHPPGYHYAVLALTGWHPTPNAARWVTLLFSLVAFLAFAATWRRFHGRRAGAALLLFALLPIVQPFCGMIYTDMPALALVLATFWAQSAGRPWLAGLCLAGACFIRQTSIIWGTCFIVVDWLQAGPVNGFGLHVFRELLRRTFTRAPGLVVVHVIVAAIILWAGRFTPGTQHGNALSANPATLHFGALLLLLLTLPLWFTHARHTWADIQSSPAKARGLAGGAAAIAFVGVALLYCNPHVWNQELWWADTSFTLVRNWPLVAADRWPLLRWLYALVAVVGVAGAWVALRRQRFCRELLVVTAFSVVLLATNALVEPRYFITPAVLLLFFAEFSRRTFIWLTGWFVVLCLAHDPLIARHLLLW